MAWRERIGIEIEGRDNASDELHRVGGAIRSMSKEGDVATGITGRFGGVLDRVNPSLVGWGKAAVGVAGGMVAFQGAQTIVMGVADAIGNASDRAESLNKVRVVFDDTADDIEDFADSAAEDLGMSEQAALEAAGTFGNLFTAMKIGEPAAADMSTALLQLTADLASFNNASPEDVLLALRSGLVGETEPLRRFGVNLNEARIQQKALEIGVWDGTAAITAGMKAQAAYALILDDTTTAQGDFERTSDGMANTMRSLDAEMEDLSAEAGDVLLPVFLELAHGIRTDVVPALKEGIDFLHKTGEEIEYVKGVAESGAPGKPIWDFLGLDAPPTIWETVQPELRSLTDNYINYMNSRRGGLQGAAKNLVDPIPTETERAAREAVSIASALPGAIAEGILERRNAPAEAMAELAFLMRHEVSPLRQFMRDLGILSSDQLKKGLASNDPATRAWARGIRDDVLANMSFSPLAHTAGFENTKSYAGGMEKGEPEIQSAAAAAMTASIVEDYGAYYGGLSIALEHARGIRAGKYAISRAAADAAAAAADFLGNSLPTAGPLARVGEAGPDIADEWAMGLGLSDDLFAAAGQRAAELAVAGRDHAAGSPRALDTSWLQAATIHAPVTVNVEFHSLLRPRPDELAEVGRLVSVPVMNNLRERGVLPRESAGQV